MDVKDIVLGEGGLIFFGGLTTGKLPMLIGGTLNLVGQKQR